MYRFQNQMISLYIFSSRLLQQSWHCYCLSHLFILVIILMIFCVIDGIFGFSSLIVASGILLIALFTWIELNSLWSLVVHVLMIAELSDFFSVQYSVCWTEKYNYLKLIIFSLYLLEVRLDELILSLNISTSSSCI